MRSPAGPAVVVLAALLTACTGATTVGTTLPEPRPLPATGNGGRAGPVVRVVDRVLPSVVNVTTDQSDLQIGGGGGRGVGTGFVVTPDGFIVTNWHVVEGASRIRVTTSGEDPRTFDARVVGGDASADLAVLKVEASGLPTLPLGRSAALRLGQPVVAIGYALALEGGPTVTAGIVSALGRVVTAQDPACDPDVCGADQQRTYRDVIQTDAAINPGNSGGPLVDLRGRVVGINTAGVQAGAAENIGFAIAIDAARPTIEEAIAEPEAPVPYLGVVTTSVDRVLAIQYGLPVDAGALVLEVAPGGPAARAGLQRGDVIVGFGGRPVEGSDGLGALIRSRRPGDRVEVAVVSADGRRRRTLPVTLGVNPLPNPAP
ncbi:MAG TPA: trypsin-like peptidase domain-containing protein [Actinomycetota bacterium]|nr:trypsin-like peptidase domain-containing protein [Actinomycetota bacterium]